MQTETKCLHVYTSAQLECINCGWNPSLLDWVNSPPHYTEGRAFEPLAVIEDWKLDYCLGNALKYISRAGRKADEVTDLRKAVFYINRRIKQLEG